MASSCSYRKRPRKSWMLYIAGARLLLNRPDPPTAIFAFNETLAVGALGAAREVGLDVPRVDSTV
jgi:LacI family transcriptional regulator